LQASYAFLQDGWGFVDKGTVNLIYDQLLIDYDNFRDLTTGALVGEEPAYRLDSGVYQIFVSLWF
jgi:hypothetical protein